MVQKGQLSGGQTGSAMVRSTASGWIWLIDAYGQMLLMVRNSTCAQERKRSGVVKRMGLRA